MPLLGDNLLRPDGLITHKTSERYYRLLREPTSFREWTRIFGRCPFARPHM